MYAGTDRGVTTFDQCENLCESDTGCYAYDHDTANSKCYTFPTKITASLYTHSDVHHTQSSCNGKYFHTIDTPLTIRSSWSICYQNWMVFMSQYVCVRYNQMC